KGSEIAGKTLGVGGLGAIGALVANMGLALGMNVVGYDPAISIDAAWRMSSKVKKMDNLQSLMAKSDFVTLHVPSIPATQHMINSDILASALKGQVILNFARGEIVDTQGIINALDSNKISRYVTDFPTPELLGRDDVIAMPHIGASTKEAEENCAMMVADQLIDFLENGNIINSVNFPAITMERITDATRITFANHNVSGVLGEVLSVLAKMNVNVLDMLNKSRGNIAYNILDVEGRPGDELIDRIEQLEHVINARMVI
ncbi:MAG: NAD(P)-binding domain-containing protein, partial [Psychrosphaera sp.]|nr:NAD(P)-binding domain-containing protein [Psychrosphaera sp.]